MEATDQPLIDKLRERGLRVTSQRVMIHRALTARPEHLTAEQVLARVAGAMPGTSLPTVYSTLELLEDLGLVRRVATGSGALLFERAGKPHAHAICRQCGAVTDVDVRPMSPTLLRRAGSGGFRPDSTQVVVWGLCADCQQAC